MFVGSLVGTQSKVQSYGLVWDFILFIRIFFSTRFLYTGFVSLLHVNLCLQ